MDYLEAIAKDCWQRSPKWTDAEIADFTNGGLLVRMTINLATGDVDREHIRQPDWRGDEPPVT